MDDAQIIARGRRVLELERAALDEAATRLDASFAMAVRLLAECRGRVIVAGIGKSGLIGRKIAATMTSTGTPASFLHPTESVHGDLGIVGPHDVAILLSKSGETTELFPLLEQLARMDVPCIGITGGRASTLAKACQVILDAGVAEEACPHDLAPTTSTTLALALGDALAVALLELKGFRAEDFARFHPGGSLGRRLLLRVHDVMLTAPLPACAPDATMRDVVVILAERRGLCCVLGADGRLAGVVTTGDLTRWMERVPDVLSLPVQHVMTKTPRTISVDALGSAAVHAMESAGVVALPVLGNDAAVVGVVHLHDLLRAGAA
jgi:arabinose-5-phosphate isomerase